MISAKGKSCPDLAEALKGENVTAVECISADGWQMDPMIIFTSQGAFTESWFHGSENLPLNVVVGVSAAGWINDELALTWLYHFIATTGQPDRLKRGEKRYLIFDGHGSHLTLEFL